MEDSKPNPAWKDRGKNERIKAEQKLMGELEKGRLSGEKEGWISTDDVREYFKDKK